MERYKHKVRYWMTFNEINNQSNTGLDLFGWTCSGIRFSQLERPREAMYQAVHHQFVAGPPRSGRAMRSIRNSKSDACAPLCPCTPTPVIRTM